MSSTLWGSLNLAEIAPSISPATTDRWRQLDYLQRGLRDIAVDFDGVICQIPPEMPRELIDWSSLPPVEGSIEALHLLRRLGFRIVLYTARWEDLREETVEWLEKHAVPYDELVIGKPQALFYVDDRAIQFKNWIETINRIQRFKKSVESPAELPTPLTMVHYADKRLRVVRPLTYWELYQNRKKRGKKHQWDSKEAYYYIMRRAAKESVLRMNLKRRGYEYDPIFSFVYATILGKARGASSVWGGWRHEAPLTNERIEKSFFFVVGLPKEFRPKYEYPEELAGREALDRAIDYWTSLHSRIRAHKYMGMKIIPRIEIITPDPIVPTSVTRA